MDPLLYVITHAPGKDGPSYPCPATARAIEVAQRMAGHSNGKLPRASPHQGNEVLVLTICSTHVCRMFCDIIPPSLKEQNRHASFSNSFRGRSWCCAFVCCCGTNREGRHHYLYLYGKWHGYIRRHAFRKRPVRRCIHW